MGLIRVSSYRYSFYKILLPLRHICSFHGTLPMLVSKEWMYFYVFLCLLVSFFAIVTSIYDEIQRGILVIGGFAPICLYMSYNITGRSWLLLQSSECIKILICAFQIMYIVITVVTATSDWRRLLWFIPVVPFETISFFLRPRERSSICTNNADTSSEG